MNNGRVIKADISDADEGSVVCPYCGQVVCADDGQDPREACQCQGACDWRDAVKTFDKMKLAINRLFGENCGDIEPSWKPIDEESYAFLCECAERVVFCDGTDAVSVKLADSSTAVIVWGQIERRMSLKRKAVD